MFAYVYVFVCEVYISTLPYELIYITKKQIWHCLALTKKMYTSPHRGQGQLQNISIPDAGCNLVCWSRTHRINYFSNDTSKVLIYLTWWGFSYKTL